MMIIKILIFFLIIVLPIPALSETSVNVDLDSWVYPALERLASSGLIESGSMNTKPLTRIEVARLFGEAIRSIDGEKPPVSLDEINKYLLKKAKKNFKDELAILGVIDAVKVETFIKPIDEISLRYDFLDGEYNLYNDEGIKHGDKNNLFLEFSGRTKFFNIISLYYQPIVKYYQNPGNNEENTEFNLEKGYAKLNLGNIEFEIGRDSMWWGPGYHGSLLMTNNAEPFDMVKISNPTPILLPWIFRYLGPFKVAFMLSRLEEDRPIPEPYLYGLRLNIKPLPTFELGM
ncbi:MAG: capsule assembly Wzi family protein, partial [Syntrophales bacterium]|nr:capsule assembly Wzi family protein [Syntrophales bacterium]